MGDAPQVFAGRDAPHRLGWFAICPHGPMCRGTDGSDVAAGRRHGTRQGPGGTVVVRREMDSQIRSYATAVYSGKPEVVPISDVVISVQRLSISRRGRTLVGSNTGILVGERFGFYLDAGYHHEVTESGHILQMSVGLFVVGPKSK